MRNELLNAYYRELGPEAAKEFKARYNKMDAQKRQLVLHQLSTRFHEIRNKHEAKNPKWDINDAFYERGGEFNKDEMYVPKVEGQEVTYDGLVPVGQQVYLVENENQGVEQPRPRRTSSAASSRQRGQGEVAPWQEGRMAEGIESYGLEPARDLDPQVANRLRLASDEEDNFFYDPQTNAGYYKTQDGRYQQVLPRFQGHDRSRRRRALANSQPKTEDQQRIDDIAEFLASEQFKENSRTDYPDRIIPEYQIPGLPTTSDRRLDYGNTDVRVTEVINRGEFTEEDMDSREAYIRALQSRVPNNTPYTRPGDLINDTRTQRVLVPDGRGNLMDVQGESFFPGYNPTEGETRIHRYGEDYSPLQLIKAIQERNR